VAVGLADRLLATPGVRHLHAHFAHGATTVTWLAAMITGLSFSFTAHAKDIYCASLNPAGLLRRKLTAARFVVTCTEANRAYLQQLAPGAAVHRVYHGVNADFAGLLAEAPARPPANGRLHVLGVGRLVPKKGFDIFVEACGILQDRGLAFEAAIVGEDGEHGEEVRRLIRARGLERRIALVGPLSQAELFEEYRRASVFCLTCRVVDNGDRDGIPNVLVEAMAGGLPVVTTGISGIPELVSDGINGVLVQPEDPHAVADAILCLHRQPTLAGRLAREAELTVRERFDGDANARRLAALFWQVVP
jgi:glycosyltransferase involved in cell wall biosynthesis